ncbi:nuclear transport factor 2 family protein [Pseudonocardia saturnea]
MTTTQKTALQVVRATYEAFGRGDIPAVLSHWHPQIAWTEPAGSPYAGTHTGPQAVVDNVFADLTVTWTGFTVTPDEYIDAGDIVVVLGHFTGAYTATGKSFRVRFAHIVRVRDGLVTTFESIADTKLFVDAMS